MTVKDLKMIVIAMLVGAGIALLFVYLLTANDKAVVHAKEKRDAIITEHKSIKIKTKTIKRVYEKNKRQLSNEEKNAKESLKKIQNKTTDDELAKAYSIIEQQDVLISILERNIHLKEVHINELNLVIETNDQLYSQAMLLINENIMTIQSLKARDKTLKIVAGVGIAGALVGGVVAGLYIPRR